MIIRREALAAIVLSNNGFGQTNRKALIDAISEGSACHCIYLPAVFKREIHTISFYYAEGQRIAMKDDGVVSYLYGDQLGSTTVVANASGAIISRSLYRPWGTTRYTGGTNPTDYAYTGQMKEGDIYFYNARWYEPSIGRFMQADSIIPPTQGIQGYDRFAYVNNNPMVYRDENGHWITTLVGGIIGAAIGYGVQVYQNVQSGMEFGDALTTNISAEKILAGAAAGALVGTLIPVAATAISTTGLFTTGTTTTAACADGDCTNEIRMLAESGLNTIDDVDNSELGQAIARMFTHNPSSSTVSIGSGTCYTTAVGENMNYTYFSTTENAWRVLQNLPDHIFNGINTAFMQQQMIQGKEFVSSILKKEGPGFIFERELLHLWGYVEHVVNNKYSSIFNLPK